MTTLDVATLDATRTHKRRWTSANGLPAELIVFDQDDDSTEPTGLVVLSVELVEQMLTALGYQRDVLEVSGDE